MTNLPTEGAVMTAPPRLPIRKVGRRQRPTLPPTDTCPEWCVEHEQEITGQEDAFPGELFVLHRYVLDRHYYPAQRHNWPDGVRVVEINQAVFRGHTGSVTCEMTLWPGKDNQSSQYLSKQELVELIDTAQAALALMDSAW